MQTVYVVQAFMHQSSSNTRIIADTPIACASAEEAMNRAERMADKRVGVLAIAQAFDPDTEEYGVLTVLARYGEIPPNALGDD